MATLAHPLAPRRTSHRFYSGMNMLLLALVLIGFGPSYYFLPWLDTPGRAPFSLLLHVHAAVATAWFVLMVVQPMLVSSGKSRAHMRLGLLASGIAVLMVLLGIAVGLEAVERGSGAPETDPRMLFAIPFFGAVLFGGIVAAAVALRNRPEAHKRLMLLSSAAIIDAATGRILPVADYGVVGLFAGPAGVIACGIAYDVRTRGRSHPAWIYGGSIVAAVHLLRLPLMFTEPWLQFTDLLLAFCSCHVRGAEGKQ